MAENGNGDVWFLSPEPLLWRAPAGRWDFVNKETLATATLIHMEYAEIRRAKLLLLLWKNDKLYNIVKDSVFLHHVTNERIRRGLNKLWNLCTIPLCKYPIKYVQTKPENQELLALTKTTTITWDKVIHVPSKSYHIKSKITLNVNIFKNAFVKPQIKHILNISLFFE